MQKKLMTGALALTLVFTFLFAATASAATPTVVDTVYVSRYTAAVSINNAPGTYPLDVDLELGDPAVTLCVNRYTGAVLYRPGGCWTSSLLPVVVSDTQHPIFYVSRYTGQLRYFANGTTSSAYYPIQLGS